MKILAIETSCDETAMAFVDVKGGLKSPRFKVLKNIVLSQIKVHRPFGGVVPNLAKREHIRNLPKILNSIFGHPTSKNYRVNIGRSDVPRIDAIAVTVGPGLEPALWQGIEFAKKLSKDLKKPLIGVNHMEGHLFSNWLPRNVIASEAKQSHKNLSKIAALPPVARNDRVLFPAIALVVSGGHTILLKMDSLTKWKKLGETRDDAAGEAFDKVARMLKLPYPGGPEIQKLAQQSLRSASRRRSNLARSPRSDHGVGARDDNWMIPFPRPMLKDKNYDFSFSGLKTAVLYFLRESASSPRKSAAAADVAAAFQQAVIDVLVGKTMRAARQFRAKSVLLCGGVAANRALRESLRFQASRFKIDFHVPDFEYNTDNAAMIAAAAYIQKLRNKKLRLTAQSNLNL